MDNADAAYGVVNRSEKKKTKLQGTLPLFWLKFNLLFSSTCQYFKIFLGVL